MNIEVLDGPGWHRPNWAYTGFNLTDFLFDGKWHKAEYRLLNDTEKWTYGGGTRGYQYGSIDFCQQHLNCDFFHLLAFIDIKNPPSGAIDFADLEIGYRNYSLLFPSNGGKLTIAPKSPEDPAKLTDGWRNGKGKTWHSAANPTEPQEFLYSFESPVTIHTVQIHQNPEWPAKDVEVLASMDGKTFASIAKAVVPEKDPRGPNFLFARVPKLSAQAKFLKVRILTGYKKEHWGLGEIEAFGTGAVMLPDDDLYYVNTDILNLKPGATYHYRLVATSSKGTNQGEDRTFTTPESTKPMCHTGPASRITATSAKVEGRLNPLGVETQFYFEYGPDTKYGSKTPATRGGIEFVPRTAFAQLSDLKKGTQYHYRLVGVNASGTSFGTDGSFTTAP
jgi:hypothetical protein